MRKATFVQLTSPALVLAALAACSESATGPSSSQPAMYSLDVALEFIWVDGDCEDTPGNPGEFAYEIRVEAPVVGSAKYETPGFPNTEGVTYSEDRSYQLGSNLRLAAVPDARRNDITLRFSAIEFDPSGRDSRMNYEQEVVPIPFRSPTAQQRAVTIRVGPQSGCRLSLTTLPVWTLAN